MHFNLAFLSTIAIAATGVMAQAVPKAGTFDTWDALGCVEGPGQFKHPHNEVAGNVCTKLESGQNSIRVYYLLSGCTLQLHADSQCTDAGPTFPADGLCKPIPVPQSAYYKIDCV